MQNIVKNRFSLPTSTLFYWVLFFLLSFFSSNSFAIDEINEIDEKTVKELQETVVEIQFQIKESRSEISELQQILRPLRLNLNNHSKSISKSSKSVKVIDSTLASVNDQLTTIYKRLDSSDAHIKSNHKVIDKLNEKLLIKAREIRVNTSNLIAQKTLIEDNSIRLYEILIQSDNLNNEMKKIGRLLKDIENVDVKEELKGEIYVSIDQLWHLLATVLVFFAPLAFVLSSHFKPLEDGVEQYQGVVLVILAVFLGYFILGFGLMYGGTNAGWIGMTHYLISPPETTSSLQPGILLTEFVLYQIGFAMLAAMIVYTAVGLQLSSLKHLLLASFVAAVLIPIFGHWTWAGHFMVDNKGWLENSGFIDQGGAIVVNAVSAFFALFIVIRLGKSYPPPADITEDDNDPTYSSGAILLLWLSWLGFTTGNLSIADEKIARVMLNVGLAGSTGGLIAYLHIILFYPQKNRIVQGLGGFVTGLVAISACAQNVTHLEAVAIGASAGLLQNIGYQFLLQYILRLQWQRRTASLVAIHGIGGIWGAICVGLFTTDGAFNSPDMNQLMTQFIGVGVAIFYSFLMTKIVLFFLKPSKKSQQIAL